MSKITEDELMDAAISWCDSNGINVLEPEQLSSLVNSLYITVRDVAPKALEPLSEARVKEFYESLKDDKRSQNFTNENWFQCGIATAEAAHGITKGTP